MKPPAMAAAAQDGAERHDYAVEYFVPRPSMWPIRTGIVLLLLVAGASLWLNGGEPGPGLLAVALLLLALVLIGWFRDIVGEGNQGVYDAQVDRSFRWGMATFIFTEVMFFGGLFATLFYVREISIPDLAHGLSAELWPGFKGGWPATGPGIDTPLHPMSWRGAPALNTIILLASGVAITWAGAAARSGKRTQLIIALALTLALGVRFLVGQAGEYHHAFSDLGLTLGLGAYGATFFILTGFHGLHVTIGATMVAVVLARTLMRQVTPTSHFILDAVSWYWHFVGVVWLLLFVVVYLL